MYVNLLFKIQYHQIQIKIIVFNGSTHKLIIIKRENICSLWETENMPSVYLKQLNLVQIKNHLEYIQKEKELVV